MLARLEEFETMFAFIQPDIKDSKDLLHSITEYKSEFDSLCAKIDNTELLIAHVKHNLDTLEAQVEDGEAKMNLTDTASKVTNLLTPLLFVSLRQPPVTNRITFFLRKKIMLIGRQTPLHWNFSKRKITLRSWVVSMFCHGINPTGIN